MIGDGIDMYDLLPDLQEEELYSTCKKFWVGVIEGMYPSPPVPRRKTRCFSGRPVYIFNETEKVFKGSDDEFYKIPKAEESFIF